MAVKKHGVSVRLACRAFGISEHCYRYTPLLSDENALVAERLIKLTNERRNWGFEVVREAMNDPVDHSNAQTGGALGALLFVSSQCPRLQVEPQTRQADLLRTRA